MSIDPTHCSSYLSQPWAFTAFILLSGILWAETAEQSVTPNSSSLAVFVNYYLPCREVWQLVNGCKLLQDCCLVRARAVLETHKTWRRWEGQEGAGRECATRRLKRKTRNLECKWKKWTEFYFPKKMKIWAKEAREKIVRKDEKDSFKTNNNKSSIRRKGEI